MGQSWDRCLRRAAIDQRCSSITVCSNVKNRSGGAAGLLALYLAASACCNHLSIWWRCPDRADPICRRIGHLPVPETQRDSSALVFPEAISEALAGSHRKTITNSRRHAALRSSCCNSVHADGRVKLHQQLLVGRRVSSVSLTSLKMIENRGRKARFVRHAAFRRLVDHMAQWSRLVKRPVSMCIGEPAIWAPLPLSIAQRAAGGRRRRRCVDPAARRRIPD